ncbi:MAG: hypothetical protein JRD49_09100 [Deltaproteobacteria bacterium]|nr:hypothetical protein [Deltaproteobacteria bacterium]MBW2677712.1 hypothetical protein [Deltaproteobacteria bacterium]
MNIILRGFELFFPGVKILCTGHEKMNMAIDQAGNECATGEIDGFFIPR